MLAVDEEFVKVIAVPYGEALVARQFIPKGTVVEKFIGRDVPNYDDLTEYEKIYVLNYQPKGSKEWKWLHTSN